VNAFGFGVGVAGATGVFASGLLMREL
jgi:hypothetical protein